MVAVLLADGFEEIEALSVVDILRRAEIDTNLVSTKKVLGVIGRSRISINADCLIGDIEYNNVRMVVLPGGMPGCSNLETNKDVQNILWYFRTQKKWLSAICAAPYILGKAGCLEGLEATCYPGFEKFLKGANIVNKNVVKSGNVITSKGAGTALEFAFTIVEVLKDKETAEKIKDDIIYRVN